MLRTEILAELPRAWDIIIVGGGMTGAGVFRDASCAGYRTLLLEQRDFAWGTSSRSGKLVHGGLRYLSQGQIKTTWHSVRERERLLKDYPGLVRELSFVVPVYTGLTGWMMKAGLTVYDGMAFRRSHRYQEREELVKQIPEVNRENLRGGFSFRDAWTDDARLVFRVIREGERFGGTALNYMQVEELLRDRRGRVKGVTAMDALSGGVWELNSQVVVNATGVWADKLREQFGEKPRLRKLRGSHLLLPFARLPLIQAVSFSHPVDHRPLYAMPWLGKTLVGTTDIEHEHSLKNEPRMSRSEEEYLLMGLKHGFPECQIQPEDVLSTFAGVRPVLNTGKSNPSQESRDHAIWAQGGLVTVTGGKLTTFPLLARKVMRETGKWLDSAHPGSRPAERSKRAETETKTDAGGRGERIAESIGVDTATRLASRYGEEAQALLSHANPEQWVQVPESELFWAELAWSAEKEQVVHLEDLLLRRTRLGLLLPGGGAHILPEVRKRISPVLGWDERRWEKEISGYLALWQQAYSTEAFSSFQIGYLKESKKQEK